MLSAWLIVTEATSPFFTFSRNSLYMISDDSWDDVYIEEK